MKYITIIGTVGVPANYGGFETLVENVIGEMLLRMGIIRYIVVVKVILRGLVCIKVLR